ncbi:hypothetical protein OIU78_007525 [Salix suchowensis]|nr:hypothetical protein OIU78_007525 [Salix suchowensis]
MALPNKQVPAPPLPPKHQPPKAAGLVASSNLPPFHKSESGGSSTALGSTIEGTRNGQVKVKSLHWDKVDKINGGLLDTLEKLMRIAPTKEESQPTKEEESQILKSSGNPTRLADTESFLFYLLKVVPSVLNSLM